jgi:hypothetical protein
MGSASNFSVQHHASTTSRKATTKSIVVATQPSRKTSPRRRSCGRTLPQLIGHCPLTNHAYKEHESRIRITHPRDNSECSHEWQHAPKHISSFYILPYPNQPTFSYRLLTSSTYSPLYYATSTRSHHTTIALYISYPLISPAHIHLYASRANIPIHQYHTRSITAAIFDSISGSYTTRIAVS